MQALERGNPMLQPLPVSLLSLKEQLRSAYRQPHETELSRSVYVNAAEAIKSLPADDIWAMGQRELREAIEEASSDFESVGTFKTHATGLQSSLSAG